MQQNTPEWIEWRKQGLGASDAPVIMGVSPYSTPYELWEQKTGRSDGPHFNDAMKRGNDLEPVARALYEQQRGVKMTPILVECADMPWLRASLDGYNAELKLVLEIKCPGEKDHALAKKGIVPEKYIPQLQHQLFVSGAKKLHYWSYDGENGALVEVFPDPKLQSEIVAKEKAFWQHVKDDTPPPLSERDFMEETDSHFLDDVVTLSDMKDKLDALTEEFKTLRQSLIDRMKHPKIKALGVKFTRVTSKGSVDYKKIPVLRGIDLDPYRKPDQTSYRVTFPDVS